MKGFAYPLVIVGVVCGVLGILLVVQTKRLEDVRIEYGTFVSKVEALGKEQERKAKLKEAQDAKQIKDAVTERDIALTKLRQQRPSRSKLSRAAEAPSGSGQICFPEATYNAAIGRYRERLDRGLGGIQPLAIEGDAAQIDAKTLLRGWPQQQ